MGSRARYPQGDWAVALGAKKRQLLNHYMAQEAAQAEKDVQKAVDYLNKFTGRKQPKGVWRDSLPIRLRPCWRASICASPSR